MESYFFMYILVNKYDFESSAKCCLMLRSLPLTKEGKCPWTLYLSSVMPKPVSVITLEITIVTNLFACFLFNNMVGGKACVVYFDQRSLILQHYCNITRC